MIPLKKNKTGQPKGPKNKTKEDEPCPKLKGRKRLLKLLKKDDMAEEVNPFAESSSVLMEALDVESGTLVIVVASETEKDKCRSDDFNISRKIRTIFRLNRTLVIVVGSKTKKIEYITTFVITSA